MRQDKLNLIKPLPSAPVLNCRGPSMARVAQSVDEDDRCGVARGGREDQGCHTSGHFDSAMRLARVEREGQNRD